MGVSAVLGNTSKGLAAITKCSFDNIVEVSFEDIAKGNPVLVQPCQVHKNRSVFFKKFASKEKSTVDLIEWYLGKKDVALLSFPYSFFNYGALQVPFAMERIIRELRYNPHNIYFCQNEAVFGSSEKHPFSEFKNRFLNITGICYRKNELVKHISKKFDRYIVGSDQVFRWHNDFVFMLDWVSGNKQIISYAASFGINRIDTELTSKKSIKYMSKCLSKFDVLSVCENSSLNILNKAFGLTGECHIDPTLLLEASDCQEIIEDTEHGCNQDKYIAYYMLSGNNIKK